MQIAARPQSRDVYVSLSVATGKRVGTLTQFRSSWPDAIITSTNLEVSHGTMRRGRFGSHFSTERTHRTNFNYQSGLHPVAAQSAQAIDQAYEAFRLLGLPTAHGPEAYEALDRLVIEGADGFWSFDRATAPKEAFAVYQAAAGAFQQAGIPILA